MDNLCHTLVGLGLAESGLKRKTALGTATLLVGANLPDLDVLAYLWGPVTALGFRRGWTHGVLALALWPLILAGLMLAWDRWVRRRREPGAAPADTRWLVGLAAIAVTSHPLLDFLNTYGVRFLMPFNGRWYYGDTLFIVDQWVWLALGAGAAWSHRRWDAGRPRAARPARVSLVLVVVYIALMGAGTVIARRMVWREAQSAFPGARRLMAAPVPLLPTVRGVTVELPGEYRYGELRWFGRRGLGGGSDHRRREIIEWNDSDVFRKNDMLPEAMDASRTPEARAFLRWARFPAYSVEPQRDSALVRIWDARYPGQGWAEVAIKVGRPLSFVVP